ncbi:MAG: hypothetical protein CMJ50_07060 [Planctomycetaceae bacterium]|nr:hypothetical protein [Planctomycetaceae bacterium]
MYAEVVQGNTTSLRTSPHGRSRILWKEPGLGLKWSVVRLSDRPRFAVFELPSRQWQTGDSGADPPEPDGWAKMPDCKPVFYFADEFTYRADNDEDLETVWHQVGYPPKERSDVIALHSSTGLLPSKFGEKDWVWCFWNEYEGRWQVLAEYEDHWRFQLLEPLRPCGTALAQLVLYDGTYCPVALTFSVVDSIGIFKPEETSSGSSGGPTPIPAGTYGFAKHFADSDKWEVYALGEGCCPKSSSSSSGSPSSQSTSPSSEPPSVSSEPSSVPSSTPSSAPSSQPSEVSPSEPPSSQPSDEPSSQPSESPPSESPKSKKPASSQQSDKSTAIVPASWSPTGYAALFIAEMPEVRFDDVMTATVVEDETLLPIDPKFMEVCEPGSVQVCGCVPDLPVPVGAIVENGAVHVRLGVRDGDHPISLTIRLTGIRKGFSSQRFPDRTEQQFIANEEFIRSAYPGATK